jgi:Mn-dependent DtxR family transcriptional regulator
MSTTARTRNVVRKRAEWMRPVDERIMETMRDEGNLTPYALDETFDIAVANYASNRLSKLAEYGLVERLGRGLYRLTEQGEAFLDEDLDASELEPADE